MSFKSKIDALFLFAVVLTLVMAGAAAAQDRQPQQQPWTAQQFRLVDKADEIVELLPNGMLAIVKENHTAPVASVRLYVRAGSIYEQGQYGAGLSHLFEHLLMGGETKNRTEAESRAIIERIGARYNAFTGKGRTCYFLNVPAQHVGTALNLIADWVTRPTFPEPAFKREWDVVQRELEMTASDPGWIMQKLSFEIRYKQHPARYPIIGYQSIVRQLTRQEILDYYNRMYVPDNCIIAVAGAVDATQMLEAIKKEFADFKRQSVPQIVIPEEPDVSAPREIVKVFPPLRGPAKMEISFPSFKLQHPDLYSLDTLASIMGEGKSSRLYRRLREKDNLVYDVTAYNYTPAWAEGTFTIACELEPENIPPVRQAIREEIDKLRREGVSPEELQRAKRGLQVNHIRRNQTAEQQASNMAEDYLATGDPHFSDLYVQRMDKVTAETVQAMAEKYFDPDKQMTLILTSQPLSSNATEREKNAPAGEIKKITLDNGLRILLKRNPVVPLVNIHVFVLGGLFDETEKNNGITNLMVNLSTRGTENYTSDEIIDYFDSIGGKLVADCGNNTFFYELEVMKQDFSEAMNRFSEIVLQPVFPEQELARLKPNLLATLEQLENSWPMQASRFFREKFFVNSPYERIKLGHKDAVTAVTRDDIAAFHQKMVVGNRTVIAVFGDIDVAQTEQVIREKFAALPAGSGPDVAAVKPEPPVKETREFIKPTEKEGATIYVGYPGMKITNIKDRYPMDVLTEIIGSTTGRLFELLRGKGLVYYVWGFNFPALTPGFVAATAQCEAARTPEVKDLILKEMQKAAKGDFTAEEISRAKSKLINAEILSKQTNAEAARQAALDELYGFGYDWSQGHANRILAITPEDVQRVAREYLTKPPTITIITSQPDRLKSENTNSE